MTAVSVVTSTFMSGDPTIGPFQTSENLFGHLFPLCSVLRPTGLLCGRNRRPCLGGHLTATLASHDDDPLLVLPIRTIRKSR
jgi:hypothetical protein